MARALFRVGAHCVTNVTFELEHDLQGLLGLWPLLTLDCSMHSEADSRPRNHYHHINQLISSAILNELTGGFMAHG
jgi:hypothetical protein